MPLFAVREPERFLTHSGIEFHVFTNSEQLFNAYNAQQENMMFTNCFEYVNKNSLNAKYDVLYLIVGDKIYLYIHHKKKDIILAYNYESYQYLLDEYGIETEIKFMAQDEIDALKNDCRTGTMLVDAVYDIRELFAMEGTKYKSLRKRLRKFCNYQPDALFREYVDSDRQSVQEMYDSWKTEKKENGSMIVDARVFKSGLDSAYMKKFVLLDSDGNLLAFAALYNVRDWCYFYSGKTIRGDGYLGHTDVYFTYCILEYWIRNFPDVRYMSVGAIDNPGLKSDFKEQMKPAIYLTNYINVKIKELK